MNRMLSSLLAVGLAMLPAVACGQASAPAMAHEHATAAQSLTVTVGVATATLSVVDLQALPQKTATVHNAHTNTEQVHTGPLLKDVLAKAGAGEASLGKALLHSYVKASGTDGYWVLYSGIEMDPSSHGGKPLAENGQMMLVSTEESKPQRWVRNLAALTLVKVE